MSPCTVKCVLNEGMPHYRNIIEKGRLIIHFVVKFPPDDFIPAEKLSELEKIFPERTEVIVPDDSETCTLAVLDPNKEKDRRRGESDDETHGHNVQCAQQ